MDWYLFIALWIVVLIFLGPFIGKILKQSRRSQGNVLDNHRFEKEMQDEPNEKD